MTKREPVDLSQVQTYPFRERKSKVTRIDFAHPLPRDADLAPLWKALPSILAGRRLRALAMDLVRAREASRAVLAMIGGHVVKCGVSPHVLSLAEDGFITHLALNGATAIHDFEIARWGATSEEVAETLPDGKFGLVEETGREMNEAVARGWQAGWGMGESLGRYLEEIEAEHREVSLLAGGRRLGLPVTVHVVVGGEITHQHPACDGAAVGATSHLDFRILASSIAGLGDAGVVINFGSAVVLPEVFVKALSVARNLGHEIRRFSAADFDMIRHYRPTVNVLERPNEGEGPAYAFTGHHEIMLPLLVAAVRAAAEGREF